MKGTRQVKEEPRNKYASCVSIGSCRQEQLKPIFQLSWNCLQVFLLLPDSLSRATSDPGFTQEKPRKTVSINSLKSLCLCVCLCVSGPASFNIRRFGTALPSSPSESSSLLSSAGGSGSSFAWILLGCYPRGDGGGMVRLIQKPVAVIGSHCSSQF